MRSVRLIGPCIATLLAASGCTGPSAETPLPSVAASLKDALPSSASVAVYQDKGDWGDVVTVMDSDERMATGPTPGETFSAAQAWLASHDQALHDAGFDHVLLCNSAVNINVSTGADSRLSEMVPVGPGGSLVSVETSRASDSGNSTTMSCDA
jgi:hypothetical protein